MPRFSLVSRNQNKHVSIQNIHWFSYKKKNHWLYVDIQNQPNILLDITGALNQNKLTFFYS